MVSVFLGFTIQCAFVRQWFVPDLKEAHYMTRKVSALATEHKQVHDKSGIAESLHVYTNRATLTA